MNGRDILVASEGEKYSASDKVQVCVEGMRVIELDSDGHDGRLRGFATWEGFAT